MTFSPPWPGYYHSLTYAGWASSGKFVQAASGQIRLWDAKSGRLTPTKVNVLKRYDLDDSMENSPSDVLFSPDGARVAYHTLEDSLTPGAQGIVRCDAPQKFIDITDAAGTSISLKNMLFSSDSREIVCNGSWGFSPSTMRKPDAN